MVSIKLLLENTLRIRPYNCEAASEPLLPKIARCMQVLSSFEKCAERVLKGSEETDRMMADNLRSHKTGICIVLYLLSEYMHMKQSFRYFSIVSSEKALKTGTNAVYRLSISFIVSREIKL